MRLRAVLCLLLTGLARSGASAAQPGGCDSPSYDCAVVQVQRQEFAAAIRTLDGLAARASRDLRVLNLLGIALTGAGKAEQANVRFREALAIDPQFAPALRNLAVNEFTLGRHADAQRHFQAVLAQNADDEIAHVHLGEIAFERQDYRAALSHYESARTRVRSRPSWILHNATCLLELGRRADAVALLDHLPPAEAASRFEAGVVLGRHGAHVEAAKFFGTARDGGYKDAYAAGYNQVLMLIEAGENDSAIRVGTALFAQGFTRGELYNLISRAYAKLDRVKDAYDALREATRLEPAVAEHYIDMTLLCLEHENYDLGLEIVDIGLKHRPDSSMLHLQRGVVLAMKGAVEQAEQDFSRARLAAPDDPAPDVALAMVWMQRGQTPKAVDMLRMRAKASASQPLLLYALGVALLRAGAEPDSAAGAEAVEAFRAAVGLRPAFAPAQSELGKLLLKRGDVTGAVEHLERAVALEPENATPAYVLSQAYRRNGQTDRARELLVRVSRLNAQERGDDPDTDLRRAMFRIVREGTSTGSGSARTPPVPEADRVAFAAACATAGDLDGAIERLREVIDTTTSAPDARYQLAVTLWNRYQRAGGRRDKRDLDEAVATLERAVGERPDQSQFHLVLGQLFAEQQNLTSATVHLKRAAMLSPESPEPPYNLGLALRLQGDLDAAEHQFRIALAKAPEHALARRSLGLVLRQKGDAGGAATELQRAAATQPDDALAHHLLGTVLLKLGNAAGAVAELREAVRLDPSLTEARVLLAQTLAKQGRKADAQQEQAAVERLNAEKAALGRTLVLLDASAGLLAKGDVAGAVAQRREAVATSPRYAEAHYLLGLALVDAQAPPAEAEAAFREAIALDPSQAPTYAALGRLLERTKDNEGARAAYARASALAPCAR
jgi:tetratricopeptide (TPR) repeat protein